MRILGMMSGTSLDGLDMVLVSFNREEGNDRFFLLHKKHVSYPSDIQQEIRECLKDYSGVFNDHLNKKLGAFYAKSARMFLEENESSADFISNHGQTVYHEPKLKKTIQLGDARIIANETGLPVYYDFRSADVGMGGQGAPLVPIGDLNLFSEYKYCLNLGGIANISSKSEKKIDAFDICTCNVGLNYYAEQFGKEYDENGQLGRMGRVNEDLLENWNQIDFFKRVGPKSLDAGFFHREMLVLASNEISILDQLRTYYEHIALQISHSLNTEARCLVTGGGAHNDFLMERIRALSKAILEIPDSDIVDYKEAIVFAYLAYLKERGEVNVLSSVTGAPKDHSAGSLARPGEWNEKSNLHD